MEGFEVIRNCLAVVGFFAILATFTSDTRERNLFSRVNSGVNILGANFGGSRSELYALYGEKGMKSLRDIGSLVMHMVTGR